MIITQPMIEAARKQGACGPALDWLKAEPRTVADLARHNGNWVLWAAVALFPRHVRDVFFDTILPVDAAYRERICGAREENLKLEAYSEVLEEAERTYNEALIIPFEEGLNFTFPESRVPSPESPIPTPKSPISQSRGSHDF